MISLEAKTETTTSSLPIGASTKEEEPTTSFSSLLKGLKSDKDEKIIQNGALVLSLKDEQLTSKDSSKLVSKETLLSLLRSDDKVTTESIEPVELNPKITQNMSVKEMKALISDAKEYLKEKILSSDDYKLAQAKELPKTLKGLSELAQKLGIDLSKITIEEVQVKSTSKVLPELSEKKVIQNSSATTEKQIPKEVTQKEVKSDVKIVTAQKVPLTPLKNEKLVSQADATAVESKNEDLLRVENQKIQELNTPKIPKETPLFKAQVSKEHTTEQLVATKVFKPEEKTPKSRADETLKLLLRGEKPSQTSLNLTADFSVATAKVIAPSAITEEKKSLESLLHGESKESGSKLDGLSIHKTDSFEVKLNEAKQMIKYISSDVKSAIEDYKSPFTRVKVQLNPQKLGEVDLTIVSRGKNLLVTLSSNNAAINTLAANANELRVQLNNSGINNASLNFNNSSQNSEQNAQQQQQHHQNEQKADEEYRILREFGNEEQNEEILSSLEIVVPNYA